MRMFFLLRIAGFGVRYPADVRRLWFAALLVPCLAPTQAPTPTLAIFLSPGCPHNPAGVPHIETMRKSLAGAVKVIVVLPQTKAEADKTAKELGIKATILPDPERKLIRLSKATHSLDLAVLDRNGKLVKRWNGLGRKEMGEANAELKKLGVGKSVPTASLPASSLSGCGI